MSACQNWLCERAELSRLAFRPGLLSRLALGRHLTDVVCCVAGLAGPGFSLPYLPSGQEQYFIAGEWPDLSSPLAGKSFRAQKKWYMPSDSR